jgi:dihydrofolate synthase/folylpolyglutamate synthase
VNGYLASLEQFGIKLGLDQIRGLLTALDHPDAAFRSVVVAGTNGKGSATAMIERALRAAGYRTGRYTSPHLVRLEERFVIDGQEAAPATVARATETIRAAAVALPFPPSFFEATTAMAFEIFRRADVDVAVLEVGLGGRLDATNVVTPVASVITAVDFDHEQYLGHTLEAIAAEKAGIIKAGRPVVLGRNPAAVVEVVRRRAVAVGAALIEAADDVQSDARVVDGLTTVTLHTPVAEYLDVRLALRGRHQIDNAVTAVRALETLRVEAGLTVSDEAIRTGLEAVSWPGRLELRTWRGADLLLDGAHNPAGARALAAYLRETYGRRVPMLVGIMADKAVEALLGALSDAASQWVFTAVDSPRAASPTDLLAAAARVAPDVPATASGHPMAALAALVPGPGPVVIAGSLYLCGEIREGIS